jgi:hypothetical protein
MTACWPTDESGKMFALLDATAVTLKMKTHAILR